MGRACHIAGWDDNRRLTNPLGRYAIFRFGISDSRNTAEGCPCFGDDVQLGVSGSAVFVSVSQFSVDRSRFNGSVIYAMSLKALTDASARPSHRAPLAQTYILRSTSDAFGAYGLAPSVLTTGSFETEAEYFVESDANGGNGTGLEVYAVLDNRALSEGKRPTLVKATISTEPYSIPPSAKQQVGPVPYGCLIKHCAGRALDTGLDSVQQLTFADGVLYAVLSTGVTAGTARRSGIAWFAISVTPQTRSVQAKLVSDGYLATSQYLLDPAVGINNAGLGYLSFAAASATRYPTAAYLAFDGVKGPTGPIHIEARGLAPLDDFRLLSTLFRHPVPVRRLRIRRVLGEEDLHGHGEHGRPATRSIQ